MKLKEVLGFDSTICSFDFTSCSNKAMYRVDYVGLQMLTFLGFLYLAHFLFVAKILFRINLCEIPDSCQNVRYFTLQVLHYNSTC